MKKKKIFFLYFSKIRNKKLKNKIKLPKLSNKMNRQLSKLEQSPATAPKTWCTEIVIHTFHISAQRTSKCIESSK